MLKNNKLNLLISIVCAIALWAYTTTVVNPETERTISGIKVELINIDALNDRGFTISEERLYQIEVIVIGSRSEILDLSASDFRAIADMTGYRRGAVTVPVNVTPPNNIELAQDQTFTIQVEVVDLITVIKPVILEFEDTFPRDQEPGFIQVIPEEMEISGVTEAVDNIDYIRALVPSGSLTEEMNTFRIDVVAVDKEGKNVNNVGLSQNSVEVTGMLCYTKLVTLNIETIGEANESIEVTDIYIPSYIMIRGAKEDIENITEVEGRPVDLSGITITETLRIDENVLNLPEGVEVANASAELSVHIEVQGIARQEFTFTADMIDVINLVPYLSGHVNTGSVIVTVFAPRETLGDVAVEDIMIYVDAADLRWAVESQEMDVVAECRIEVKDITVEPAKVRVTTIRE